MTAILISICIAFGGCTFIVDNSGGAHYENHAIFNETFDWSQGWTNNGLVVSDGDQIVFTGGQGLFYFLGARVVAEFHPELVGRLAVVYRHLVPAVAEGAHGEYGGFLGGAFGASFAWLRPRNGRGG